MRLREKLVDVLLFKIFELCVSDESLVVNCKLLSAHIERTAIKIDFHIISQREKVKAKLNHPHPIIIHIKFKRFLSRLMRFSHDKQHTASFFLIKLNRSRTLSPTK